MELSVLLVTFGCLLLAGLALDALGRLTRLPRITLLVLFGVAAGPYGLNLLPIDTVAWHEIVATIALTMIAFLLGGELSKSSLQAHGRAILSVSIAVTVCSMLVIGLGLWAIGTPVAIALLLAGIGLATAPAVTRDVIRETGSAGPLAKTVLGVVAIDDVWGLIVFSIILGVVVGSTGDNGGLAGGLTLGLYEVAGAIGLGLAIGLPAAFATGRIAPGEPTLAEALGIVLVCAGLSLWFEVSFLLTGIVTGAVVVNLAKHHEYPFHEIEHISWPFLIVFFVLAGASVDISAIAESGALAASFIVLRLAGRVVGGWVGGRLGGLSRKDSALVGLALTPQAGVALGMVLVASQAAPQVAEVILVTTVATTVFFELVGPILTRFALRRSGGGEAVPHDGRSC